LIQRSIWVQMVSAIVIGNLGYAPRGVATESEAGTPASPIRCAAIAERMQGLWPDDSTRILSVDLRPRNTAVPTMLGPGMPGPAIAVPEHCELAGVMRERVGSDGQHYAIHFHMRLPTHWNHDFFFQGGGGTDGEVGDALGHISLNAPVALAQGFTVVSQDAGHDNATNSNPTRGGAAAFGFDDQARRDYGRSSLPAVSDAAKALIRRYYGESPRHSYFVGCSKGGQEGMALAQYYPQEFDGILAADPGISLPRAALAEIWDVQIFQALAPPPSMPPAPPFMRLPATYSEADLHLVQEAVLAACDADDGLKDGIVGDFAACTDRKVLPQLQMRTCAQGKSDGCLSAAQVAALVRSLHGPVDQHGKALYSDWPWDAGIGSDAWRLWKLGSPGGPPALNLLIGGPATASIFTTPPSAVAVDPQSALDYAMAFDFDRGGDSIYARNSRFTQSAWDEISARSPDLSAFRARGGKLIIPHGVSDPVFSINDTLAWYREADAVLGGNARDVVRIFPVPGMAHCGGGPATDGFDAFAPLRAWVESGTVPDRIVARAGSQTPWPGRARPLCAYPAIARYSGHGDAERAENFVCR
jgi:hypothetical protein